MPINAERRRRILQYNTVDKILQAENRRRVKSENISSSVASLSLSRISQFYVNYVKENEQKVLKDLNRVGYYLLKNKISIGNDSLTTKDVHISLYICNLNMISACNNTLEQNYHVSVNIENTGGFFVPSSNEVVVIVRTDMLNPLQDDIKDADIRSTIEHEITHAFDHTSDSKRLKTQKPVPGIGSMLTGAYDLKIITADEYADLSYMIATDKSRRLENCLFAISVVLYKLFTITEFNAHQMSDLENVRAVDVPMLSNSEATLQARSNAFKTALKTDIDVDNKLLREEINKALKITPAMNPLLWTVVGKILQYLEYNLKCNVETQPEKVYAFFKNYATKLADKFINKKAKNQVKLDTSLKEKATIKKELLDAINRSTGNKVVAASFWYHPNAVGKGISNAYRIKFLYVDGVAEIKIKGNKYADTCKLYGNISGITKRALDAKIKNSNSKLEFAVDNLVDVIVQTIERNLAKVSYNPLYDITLPEDEDQMRANNTVNRFSVLEYD